MATPPSSTRALAARTAAVGRVARRSASSRVRVVSSARGTTSSTNPRARASAAAHGSVASVGGSVVTAAGARPPTSGAGRRPQLDARRDGPGHPGPAGTHRTVRAPQVAQGACAGRVHDGAAVRRSSHRARRRRRGVLPPERTLVPELRLLAHPVLRRAGPAVHVPLARRRHSCATRARTCARARPRRAATRTRSTSAARSSPRTAERPRARDRRSRRARRNRRGRS